MIGPATNIDVFCAFMCVQDVVSMATDSRGHGPAGVRASGGSATRSQVS